MDLAKQQQTIERLQKELDQLNGQYAEVKKALGVTDEKALEIEAAQAPAKMIEVMQLVREEAGRAAREAVEALQADLNKDKPIARKRSRRGALSI